MFWMLLISIALGDDEQVQPEVVYKQRTEIDFEGFEIEGELLKPHGAVIRDRKGAAFNPLIQLRTDFQTEMSQSVSAIQ